TQCPSQAVGPVKVQTPPWASQNVFFEQASAAAALASGRPQMHGSEFALPQGMLKVPPVPGLPPVAVVPPVPAGAIVPPVPGLPPVPLLPPVPPLSRLSLPPHAAAS